MNWDGLQASKSRLTRHQKDRFSGTTLFDRIGHAVCNAGTLPAKELFEAWETARRIRRLLRGGRIVDLAGGHGLLAHILMLLDDRSPNAMVIDAAPPANAQKLSDAILKQWPRLHHRIVYRTESLEAVKLTSSDIAVSVHACGRLTDTILAMAIAAKCRVAVLPCCHDLKQCDTGGLEGWMSGPMAVDATRAATLRSAGYAIATRTIPAAITPQNRLLLGWPE